MCMMICPNCGMDKHHLASVCPHCKRARPVGIKIAQTSDMPQVGWACNAKVLDAAQYNAGLKVMSDSVPCDTVNRFELDKCRVCNADRGTTGMVLV